MKNENKQARINYLKHEANRAKSLLMLIEREIEPLSKKEYRRLSAIIGRLERWQNT